MTPHRIRGRLPRIELWWAGLLAISQAVSASAPAMRPALSARAAIETARLMVDPGTASGRNPQGAVSISPDGHTYVARLVRGDVQRNGVWMQMIAGSLNSLDAATQVRTVARHFSTGLGGGEGRAGANQDTLAQASPVHWIDRDHVAFLWSDEHGVRQVVRVNVRDGRSDWLTHHPTSVVNFDASPDGVVLYCAQRLDTPRDTTQMLHEGFVIEADTDATSLMLGRINEGPTLDRLWNTQWFVRTPREREARTLRLAQRDEALDPLQRATLSPDGAWAVVNTNAPIVRADWNRYDKRNMASWVREARMHPRSMLARGVHQLWLLNTATGDSRALWDAVADGQDTQVAWSADSRTILIAPTFLPASERSPQSLAGRAVAIVDPFTGVYTQLPVDLEGRAVTSVRWRGAHRVELRVRQAGTLKHVIVEKSRGEWRRIEERPNVEARAGIRVELRQDLSTPPTLVAVDPASGRERLIVDPNPDLMSRYAFGRAEKRTGQLDSGEVWEGLLFYPPDYRRGQRYPLVIQSVYGSAFTDEFTLTGYQGGYGLGPALIAAYPGRMLAAQGVLVLQVNVDEGAKTRTPAESEIRMKMFERAAETLVSAGLVDRQRVGIVGFSRNGFHVEYTLTHSTFAFAAAIAADNWDSSYVAQTLLGYDNTGTEMHGAPPFGAGLQTWLQTAPAFGAQRVRTPLLKIEQSHALMGVLLRWEMFARLRYLRKPVELYVMPDAQHGVHNTQNPGQILAVQQRSVDWFVFWLQGQEDPDPGKQAQYARWRALRELPLASPVSAKALEHNIPST